MGSTIEGDFHVAGTLTMGGVTLPDSSITNLKVQAAAAIDPTKIVQRYRRAWAQATSAVTVATLNQVIAVITGATGTLRIFEAGAVVPHVGDSVCTVDLKKNGTTVLSSPITLNSGQSARQLVAAAISTTVIAVDDVLEVVTVATIGTGTLALGVFGILSFDEDPA